MFHVVSSLRSDPDGSVCSHGDEILTRPHWSCCGALDRGNPCSSGKFYSLPPNAKSHDQTHIFLLFTQPIPTTGKGSESGPLGVGVRITLLPGSENRDDAGSGPLKIGDTGVVMEVDSSDRPLCVQTDKDGERWWYSRRVLMRVPTGGTPAAGTGGVGGAGGGAAAHSCGHPYCQGTFQPNYVIGSYHCSSPVCGRAKGFSPNGKPPETACCACHNASSSGRPKPPKPTPSSMFSTAAATAPALSAAANAAGKRGQSGVHPWHPAHRMEVYTRFTFRGWHCDGADTAQGCKGTGGGSGTRYRCTGGCDYDLCHACWQISELEASSPSLTSTSKVKVGDRVRMTMRNGEANWAGVPGSQLAFSPGNSFGVAEIRGDYFRASEFTSLWAPLAATVEGIVTSTTSAAGATNTAAAHGASPLTAATGLGLAADTQLFFSRTSKYSYPASCTNDSTVTLIKSGTGTPPAQVRWSGGHTYFVHWEDLRRNPDGKEAAKATPSSAAVAAGGGGAAAAGAAEESEEDDEEEEEEDSDQEQRRRGGAVCTLCSQALASGGARTRWGPRSEEVHDECAELFRFAARPERKGRGSSGGGDGDISSGGGRVRGVGAGGQGRMRGSRRGRQGKADGGGGRGSLQPETKKAVVAASAAAASAAAAAAEQTHAPPPSSSVPMAASRGICALCGSGVFEDEARLRSRSTTTGGGSGVYVHADCHRLLALERDAASRWGDATFPVPSSSAASSLGAPPPAPPKLKRELTTRSRVALTVFEEGAAADVAAADVATAEDLLVSE